jgi:hypothetical protein
MLLGPCNSSSKRCSARRGASVLVASPPYLAPQQCALVTDLAVKAHWNMLGTVFSPLAAVGSVPDALPWSGQVLVGDVDGHAFTWSLIDLTGNVARHLYTQVQPALRRTAWLCRILDGVAHGCVRTCRRDPRESADTEQSLYDQLGRIVDAGPARSVALLLQSADWQYNLTMRPEELAAYCGPLLQQTVEEMKAVLATHPGEIGGLFLTTPAAGLPGLVWALERFLQQSPAPLRSPGSDFGEGLSEEKVSARHVQVLDADACARGAHELAVYVQLHQLPPGFQEAFPLPPSEKRGTDLDQANHGSATEVDLTGVAFNDEGPARLQFGHEDHILSGPVFTLGRDPACDLVFETALFPSVSARHCEIIFDRDVFILRDRSRHGTFVNDRPVRQQILQPGDWIQLGPDGPLIRFVGHASYGERIVG